MQNLTCRVWHVEAVMLLLNLWTEDVNTMLLGLKIIVRVEARVDKEGEEGNTDIAARGRGRGLSSGAQPL